MYVSDTEYAEMGRPAFHQAVDHDLRVREERLERSLLQSFGDISTQGDCVQV